MCLDESKGAFALLDLDPMRRGESRLRLEVDRALSRTFVSGQIFTHIEAALGEVTLSELARSVYQIVSLPE